MVTVKATFLLPVIDNDKRSLETEIFQVRAQLWMRFRAFTCEGEVDGVYEMPDGSQSQDKCKKYSLIFEESCLPDLEEILRSFKETTKQDKIYLEIQRGVEVRLI
jgi:hypothetical protein